jgi:ABC-type transport system involved in multi-copper enzyme maturation permease subunit
VTSALIIDTFREAFARWIFLGLFALSTVMILFFLFLLRIDVVEGATAVVSLFGQPGRMQEVETIVRTTYAAIATFLYTWGMALAVFASAGLIPRVLEPGRIELLLSKPVSRAHILLGRYAGNILVVTGNIAYLVLGVWTIVGAKTGVWDARFLWSIATTAFIFATLLAVVLLVGVVTESTALATMIALGLMIFSVLLAQLPLMMRLLSSETSRNIWRASYYILPKVYDLGRMTLDLVRGQGGEVWMPVWTSALFAGVVVAGSVAIFARRDF